MTDMVFKATYRVHPRVSYGDVDYAFYTIMDVYRGPVEYNPGFEVYMDYSSLGARVGNFARRQL